MQPAAFTANRIGAMQQEALTASIIYKYLWMTEQHCACCPKWRYAVKNVAYTYRGVWYTQNFL